MAEKSVNENALEVANVDGYLGRIMKPIEKVVKEPIKELLPLFNKVITIAKENPYLKKKTDAGIIMPRMHKSDKTGRLENNPVGIIYAIVTEVGPEIGKDSNGEPCVKVGDGVFFSEFAGYPMEFYDGVLTIINDRDIIARVVDERD